MRTFGRVCRVFPAASARRRVIVKTRKPEHGAQKPCFPGNTGSPEPRKRQSPKTCNPESRKAGEPETARATAPSPNLSVRRHLIGNLLPAWGTRSREIDIAMGLNARAGEGPSWDRYTRIQAPVLAPPSEQGRAGG